MYGTSAIGAESFRQYCASKGLRLMGTHLVPNPVKSELPIVQDFRKEALDNNVVYSAQALEAYVVGSIFVEGLRIIKGPITNDSIMKSFESMQNYAFKGLTLSFNKESRELSNTVWLDTGEGKDWTPETVHRHAAANVDAVRKITDNKKQESEKKATSWW